MIVCRYHWGVDSEGIGPKCTTLVTRRSHLSHTHFNKMPKTIRNKQNHPEVMTCDRLLFSPWKITKGLVAEEGLEPPTRGL